MNNELCRSVNAFIKTRRTPHESFKINSKLEEDSSRAAIFAKSVAGGK